MTAGLQDASEVTQQDTQQDTQQGARDVLLLGVVGSTAYGLATEASDRDRLGIYRAPSRTVLGLNGPSAVAHSQVTTDPDVTLHELGKYASLALKANPTILDLLWLPEYEVTTGAGLTLVDIRRAMLSEKAVRSAFGGYAMQQARRLVGRAAAGKRGFSADLGNRTAKHGRHCLRLLRAGAHALTTGDVLVDVSSMREELFAAGELAATDPEAFASLVERELAALENVKSVLPTYPDIELVERTVVTLRLASLMQEL